MNEEKIVPIVQPKANISDPFITELKSEDHSHPPKIESIYSSRAENDRFPSIDGTNQAATQKILVGSPVTEAERPIVNPSATMIKTTDLTIGEHGTAETVPMEKIPGVKEVSIAPSTGLLGAKGGQDAFSMKSFLKDALKEGFINSFIRKNGLSGINIEVEAKLIDSKKSKLSSSQRKAVLTILAMRQRQKELLADIGKDLLHKENVSDADMVKLIDAIEENSTDPAQLQAAAEKAINSIGTDADAFVNYAPMTEAYLVPSAPWITPQMLSDFYKIPVNQLKRVTGTFGSHEEINAISGALIGMILHVCHLAATDAEKENYQHEYYIFTENGWDLIRPSLFEGTFTEAPKALENKAESNLRPVNPSFTDTEVIETPRVFATTEKLPTPKSEPIIDVLKINESSEETPKE